MSEIEGTQTAGTEIEEEKRNEEDIEDETVMTVAVGDHRIPGMKTATIIGVLIGEGAGVAVTVTRGAMIEVEIGNLVGVMKAGDDNILISLMERLDFSVNSQLCTGEIDRRGRSTLCDLCIYCGEKW